MSSNKQQVPVQEKRTIMGTKTTKGCGKSSGLVERNEKENEEVDWAKAKKHLGKEKAELSKKMHAIKNYKHQQGCIKLELEKFRALALTPETVVLYSGAVQLAGFYWKLCAERSEDNWLGLYLCIYVPKHCPEAWECRVNFTFCIKHVHDMEACIHRCNGKPIIFSNALGRRGRSGFSDMVGIYHLLDPQSGFVDLQDSVKMGVSFSILYSTQG